MTILWSPGHVEGNKRLSDKLLSRYLNPLFCWLAKTHHCKIFDQYLFFVMHQEKSPYFPIQFRSNERTPHHSKCKSFETFAVDGKYPPDTSKIKKSFFLSPLFHFGTLKMANRFHCTSGWYAGVFNLKSVAPNRKREKNRKSSSRQEKC